MKSLLGILICLLFTQAEPQKRELDEISFTYSTYFDKDTAFWTTSSEPFGGDCTYELAIDSIKGHEYFISGKYEGDAKCYGDCAIDTVRLGILTDGDYTIHYSFVDTRGWYEKETLSTNFTVSAQNIQMAKKDRDFIIHQDGKKNIIFILKNKNVGTLKLSIYDINGREKKAYIMDKEVLKVNDLPFGVYLYRLGNQKGTLYKGKFMVEE